MSNAEAELRAEDVPAAAAPGGLLSSGYRSWLLLMLFVLMTFNFLDRAVLTALAQPIKQDLKLSDFQLGLLQGLSFALLYSTLGIPIARLAERRSRVNIIAISGAVWSVATALCGFAGGFWQLFAARMAVGVGEAGFLAPAHSLVSDHFTRGRRTSAIAVIGLGTPVGALIGSVAGGWLAQHYGWRVAFAAVGLPGLVAVLIAKFTLREPPRGLAEGALAVAGEAPPSLMEVARTLLRKKSFVHLLIGSSAAMFCVYCMGQFLMPFLLRVHRLPLPQAGLIYGLQTFLSLSVGYLFGARLSEWMGRKHAGWAFLPAAAGLLLSAPIYVIGLRQANTTVAVALFFVGAILMVLFYAPAFGAVQNLVGPRMRASAAALFMVVFNLVGAGLGPTFLGFTSDLLATRAFPLGDFAALCPGGRAAAGAAAAVDHACRSASAVGVRDALIISALLTVWPAVHFLLAARSLHKDLYVPPAEVAAFTAP